uniref:Uncharacterized protein n=1 Tax=Aegilops tauschii subsp. strangulata TaxID=200361 RepID=A0A453Q507_AEGTS
HLGSTREERGSGVSYAPPPPAVRPSPPSRRRNRRRMPRMRIQCCLRVGDQISSSPFGSRSPQSKQQEQQLFWERRSAIKRPFSELQPAIQAIKRLLSEPQSEIEAVPLLSG